MYHKALCYWNLSHLEPLKNPQVCWNNCSFCIAFQPFDLFDGVELFKTNSSLLIKLIGWKELQKDQLFEQTCLLWGVKWRRVRSSSALYVWYILCVKSDLFRKFFAALKLNRKLKSKTYFEKLVWKALTYGELTFLSFGDEEFFCRSRPSPI